MSGTAAFFHAMAPALIANVLTVAFVYCFAVINKQERSGEDEGRLTYLIVMKVEMERGIGRRCPKLRQAGTVNSCRAVSKKRQYWA